MDAGLFYAEIDFFLVFFSFVELGIVVILNQEKIK